MSVILFGSMTGVALASAPHVIIKVQDQNGTPIQGVRVKWVDKLGSTIYQTTATSSYQSLDEAGGNFTINPGDAVAQAELALGII